MTKISWFRVICSIGSIVCIYFSLYLAIWFLLIVLLSFIMSGDSFTIDNQENFINDGIAIGVEHEQIIYLQDYELNQHVLIIGTTGAGKTTTMLNFVASCATRHLPCIYLDGKGDFDLVNQMRSIAHKYDRVFKVFCLRPSKQLDGLAGYNPFGSGSATEWKNRIMALFTSVGNKGQEHFSLGEQNYINFVAQVLYRLDKTVDLRVVLAFLENPDRLLSVAHSIDPVLAQKIAKLNSDKNINVLLGDILKLLELFIYSDYGWLFNTTKLDSVINIKKSILNGEIVLFLFDASSYPEDTNKVARMVISDINSSFSSFESFTKCYCIFDEFASYASPNLAETISLQRSRGMHAIIGTQSIATVRLKSPETRRVAEELLACCNTYIVQKINHDEDSQVMAKIIGVSSNPAVNITLNNNGQSISYKQQEGYKISPQDFKELTTGEAIILRKVKQIIHERVKISQINQIS